MDKIRLKDLHIQAVIGVNPWERTERQRLLINVTITCDVSRCGKTDSIDDTINYYTLSNDIIAYSESSAHFTLEALATGIAKICVLNYETVFEATVVIDKPSALYLASAASLEITRTKQFFLQDAYDETIVDKRQGKIVYLALGSNIGNRANNIHRALHMIQQPSVPSEHFCTVLETSFLYETPPAYVIDQPSFLNCACKIQTDLTPTDLLDYLKTTEDLLGREKTIRNGPRSIDIDILFYENTVLELINRKSEDGKERDLIIPHPRIPERDFVLGPLMDIAADFIHPVLKQPIKTIFKRLPVVQLQKVLPLKESVLPLGKKTYIMGILNVTPDSFSDGGQFNSVELAVKHAKEMIDAGADIIDIGGQSTRPGADFLSANQELERVIPVIKALVAELPQVTLSIDTFHSEVARQAVLHGANIINDVSGGTLDDRMFSVASELQVPIVIMHMKGTPQTMKELAQYSDVVREVKSDLFGKACKAQSCGIYKWNILLDPGIGFAKNQDHNLQLLKPDARLTGVGFPLLYGTSRKGFIGNITGQIDPTKRVFGSAATVVASIQNEADVVRVHDVLEMRDVVLMSDAIYRNK